MSVRVYIAYICQFYLLMIYKVNNLTLVVSVIFAF